MVMRKIIRINLNVVVQNGSWGSVWCSAKIAKYSITKNFDSQIILEARLDSCGASINEEKGKEANEEKEGRINRLNRGNEDATMSLPKSKRHNIAFARRISKISSIEVRRKRKTIKAVAVVIGFICHGRARNQ
jgi:hypothetical protein